MIHQTYNFQLKYTYNAELILTIKGDSNFNVVFVNQMLIPLSLSTEKLSDLKFKFYQKRRLVMMILSSFEEDIYF